MACLKLKQWFMMELQHIHQEDTLRLLLQRMIVLSALSKCFEGKVILKQIKFYRY